MKGFNTKICTKCHETKFLIEFPYKDSKKIARRTQCKVCYSLHKKKPEYKEGQRVYANKRRSDPIFRNEMIQKAKIYGATPKGRAIRLFLAAKQRANVYNLEFTITKEWIEEILIKGNCQKTGIAFDMTSPIKTNYNPYSPSIDKKDSFGGYTKENVQIVCNAYNIAKHQFSDEEFLKFCQTVVEKNT